MLLAFSRIPVRIGVGVVADANSAFAAVGLVGVVGVALVALAVVSAVTK